MDEFLAIATSLPTAVYSVLVVASLGYWVVGMLGMAGDHGDGDADIGDAGHADAGDVGDADVGDSDLGDAGDAEVGGHGHANANAAHADYGDDGGALDAVMGLLTFLKLRNAPLSITLSILFLFSWLFTYFGALHGLPHIPGPTWLSGTAIALAALVPAIPITSLLTKPLAPLFKQNFAPGRRHLVGRVGVVRIGGGKDGSAQVRLKDPKAGEKGLLLRVATDDDLKSGDEVLLIDYDDDKKSYVAEPMESVLPSKKRHP